MDEKAAAAAAVTDTAQEAIGSTDSAKKSTSGVTDVQEDAPSINSASNARRRKWFSGNKDSKAHVKATSTSAISSSFDTTQENSGEGDNNVISLPRPVALSRTLSIDSGANTFGTSPSQKSVSSSRNRRRGSNTSRSFGDGDSLSIRSREIEEAQDRLDLWATRAISGTERAEREMGLGDDINMGLS